MFSYKKAIVETWNKEQNLDFYDTFMGLHSPSSGSKPVFKISSFMFR